MPQMPHQICFKMSINVASYFGSLLRHHVLSFTNWRRRLPMHTSGLQASFQNHPWSTKPRTNWAQSLRKVHRKNYWSKWSVWRIKVICLWVRNAHLFLGNIGGENWDKAWTKSSSTVTNLLFGALYCHANWIDQSRRTGSSSKPLKAEASISFKAKGGLTKSRPIALAAAETKEVWFRWPLMRFFCFFQASHCFKISLKHSHDRMYQLFWRHKSENIRKIVNLK